MTWGAPLLAGIVAAIAIPALLILYFLKLRRKTVEISTTLLWKQAIQDLQANAPFQKLRKNILLLLQLLALAAILFALAQPRSDVEAAFGQRIVLLVDRSASMNAIDPESGQTRLELAKAQALEAVEAMSTGGILGGAESADQAMVVAFDETGDTLARFTGDKAQLRSAIESIEASDAGSSISQAYKLAQASRPKRILVDDAGGTAAVPEDIAIEGLVQGPPVIFRLYSDGRIDDLQEVVLVEDNSRDGSFSNAADSFEYSAIGTAADVNVGIISVGAERDYENPEEITIFVGVQSNDGQPRGVDVEFEIDGQAVLGIRTVELDAAEPAVGGEEGGVREPASAGVEFSLTEPRGFLARIRLVMPGVADGLEVDNEVLIPIPPAQQTSVAIVTEGNLFLSSALSGMPLAELVTWTPGQYAAARASGEADRIDVFLLDGVTPPTDSTGQVEPGRYLVLGAVPPPPFGVEDLGPAGPGSFLTWRRTHPVLRDITLDPIRIVQGRSVAVPEGSGVVTLAELPTGPGMLEMSAGGARAIVVPWDVAQSNWPFNVGFVVFLASAVDYLSVDAASVSEAGGSTRLFQPGEVLRTRLPLDASNVRVRTPAGEDVTVQPGSDGTVLYGPLRRTGLYRVSWDGAPGPTDAVNGSRASRVFAANLLSPDESDIAALTDLDLGSRQVTASAQSAAKNREYWPWLLLAALAVMMIEWWVFNRKVHL